MNRIVALQVGPAGEDAGGIAQVVNQISRWPFKDLSVRSCRTFHPGSLVRSLLGWTFAVAQVVHLRLFSGRSSVTVHVSQGGSWLREGSLAVVANCLGLRSFVFIHGSRFLEYAAASPSVVSWVLGRSSAALVLSPAVGERARELGAPRVIAIPNGLPDKPAGPWRRDRVILFAGEVGHRKGADLLLNAWADAAESLPGWRLQMAGPWRLPGTPPSLASCTWLGCLPHEQLQARMMTVSVLVLPSRAEQQPLVLLEALAVGTPVIATAVGGVPELFADAGMPADHLVEPGDVAALKTSIVRVCGQDPSDLARLGFVGRARLREKRSVATTMHQLELLWR